MKVRYIDKKIQDKDTENPQLIDGEVLYWEASLDKMRGDLNLKQWIRYLTFFRPEITTLLIYDVSSCDRFYCFNPECQEVGSGCKSKYIENNHSLMVSYAKVVDESKIAERKAINNAYTQEEWRIKYEEIINQE
tara:strand:- start:2987 stop:3388 length:402 start_codon:yes stop_codon:yes gene_type:complete